MAADTGNYLHLPPKQRNTFEIIELIGSARTEADRIRLVKVHLAENVPFKQLLMWNFLERIETALPPGIPPYSKNEEDGDHQTLWQYLKMFPFFVKSTQSQRMNPIRQERLFIDLLENIPAPEASIVLAVKEGKLQNKFKFMTPGLLYKADPVGFATLFEVAKKEHFDAIAEKEEVEKEVKAAEAKVAKAAKAKAAKAKKPTVKKKAPAKKKVPVKDKKEA